MAANLQRVENAITETLNGQSLGETSIQKELMELREADPKQYLSNLLAMESKTSNYSNFPHLELHNAVLSEENAEGVNSNRSAALGSTDNASFLSLHQKSGGRSKEDISDSADAQKTDRATIDLLNSSNPDKAKIIQLLKADVAGDQQAAGDGKHAGADQKNAALDQKVVAADSERLASDPNLTDQQRRAVNADISTHNLDAKYSNSDIGTEQTYIQHDQALITALQTGKGVEQAKAAVVADRQHDILMENIYIANDKHMNQTNQAVINQFSSRNAFAQIRSAPY